MVGSDPQRIGLIAGNGSFPLLVLDAARSQGMQVVVAAIKEEASPEIEQHGAASVQWLSLGELSKLIETFQREGVTRAIMAGQVKHKQIFSSIKPDWRLAKVLLSLTTRNTDSLIGAIAKVLEAEGITLMSSTALLEPMLADEGVMTSRGPATPSRPTSPTDARWRSICRASTSDRPWSSPKRHASRSKPWKAPTPPSCARAN